MTSDKSLTTSVSSVEIEKDIQDDYEFARSKYYELVMKGDEAIDLMLDVARESEHPRAFEVLSNMIKQNAEVADKLMDLQKRKKDINKMIDRDQTHTPQLTQNNVYVGSTTDLQRLLLDKLNKSKEIDNDGFISADED